MKEQKKNKRRVLVAEFAYNSQKAQFGLVMHHYSPSVVKHFVQQINAF